jgi:hypothetical protein
LALIALIAPLAGAVTLTDDEPANDSVGTAAIGVIAPAGVSIHAGELELVPGDIDFIGITGLSAGDIITVTVTPLDDADLQIPDTIVGLFDSNTTDPTQTVLCRGDDTANNDLISGPGGEPIGFGSLCRFRLTAPGNHYVGVTGFRGMNPFDCDPAAPLGDPDECLSFPFDGGIGAIPCEESGPTVTCGNYQVTIAVNALPEPGVILQLVSGAIGLAWLNRRRNRRMIPASQRSA